MPYIVVGPYALWTVPPEMAAGLPPVHNEYDEPLFAEVLFCIEDLPPVELDGRPHRRFCYVPWETRAEGPRWIIGGLVSPVVPELIDIRAVRPAEEIASFAAGYSTELKQLANAFGGPPELGWGWVAWDPGW